MDRFLCPSLEQFDKEFNRSFYELLKGKDMKNEIYLYKKLFRDT